MSTYKAEVDTLDRPPPTKNLELSRGSWSDHESELEPLTPGYSQVEDIPMYLVYFVSFLVGVVLCLLGTGLLFVDGVRKSFTSNVMCMFCAMYTTVMALGIFTCLVVAIYPGLVIYVPSTMPFETFLGRTCQVCVLVSALFTFIVYSMQCRTSTSP